MTVDQPEAVSTVTQQVIGGFHPYLAFFPLMLFIGALVADIFYYMGKSKGFTAGHIFVILGWLSCIPVVVTGHFAILDFDATNAIVSEHQSIGYVTMWASSAYVGLRISAYLWNVPLLPIHYVGFSALMVAVVLWASNYGYLINLNIPPLPSLEELKFVD